MTASERAELLALRELPEDRLDDHDWEMMDNVLDGTERMDASHAGGEFEEVLQGMEDDIGATRRQAYNFLSSLSTDVSVHIATKSQITVPVPIVQSNVPSCLNHRWRALSTPTLDGVPLVQIQS
jgi:hypothetical protein